MRASNPSKIKDRPHPNPLPECRARENRRAFTLLEVMVAMTVIVILAGMLMVAVHGIFGSNKANQTRAALGTLRGMLTEYENATHFQNPPTEWEWQSTNNNPPGPLVETAASGFDFWRTPYVSLTNTGKNSAGGTVFPADPLIAPPSVQVGVTDRYGSIAVINTQIVMNLLGALPVNRATLQNTSNHATDFLQWSATTATATDATAGLTNGSSSPPLPVPQLPLDFTFGVCWNPLGATPSVSGGTPNENQVSVGYVVGVQVLQPGSSPPIYWQWINPTTIWTNTNATLPASPNVFADPNWRPMTTAPTPLFIDAWGNPIIFVPASGLLVRSTSQIDGAGKQMPILIQSPDHKPFFASAGPDGDFSSGDDNLYSFEQ